MRIGKLTKFVELAQRAALILPIHATLRHNSEFGRPTSSKLATHPRFILKIHNRHLPAGAYQLTGSASKFFQLHGFRLYFDCGHGFNEVDACALDTELLTDGRWRSHFKLPIGVQQLGLDCSPALASELKHLLIRCPLRKQSIHGTVALKVPRRRTRPPIVERPLISIIMPVCNAGPQCLSLAMKSIQAQTYENWELCICDDASIRADTVSCLEDAVTKDRRVRMVRIGSNVGISRATNKAIDLAIGEFVAFMGCDDELEPDALEAYVARLNAAPHMDAIYCDEDEITVTGERGDVVYKPAWSPHFLREAMYVGHLLMVRRTIVRDVGMLDPDFDGIQGFELMLRVGEKTEQILHEPLVLYHSRRRPCNPNIHAKDNLGELQVRAVNAHLDRMRVPASCIPDPRANHRTIVVPREPKTPPWNLDRHIDP